MKRLREKFRNLAYGLAVHALALTISLAPVGANAISDADQAVREREVERDAEIAEKNAEDAAKAARDRAAQNQKDAQQSAAKGSEKGGMMANILGMALMAGGAVMVTVGTVPCAEGACNWPLIAAGVFTIAGGVGSMMAGQAMNKNADKGFQNVGGLDSIGPLGTATTPTTTGKMNVAGDQSSNSAKGEEAIATAGNKVDIDPDQLRNGKLGEIMDKFEAATGIKRDDFARGVAAGISPAELLKGVGGLSKDELQNAIDNAANTGGAGGGAIGAGDIEKLAKDMGLEDMYAKAVNDEGVDFGAGARAAPLPPPARQRALPASISANSALRKPRLRKTRGST